MHRICRPDADVAGKITFSGRITCVKIISIAVAIDAGVAAVARDADTAVAIDADVAALAIDAGGAALAIDAGAAAVAIDAGDAVGIDIDGIRAVT